METEKYNDMQRLKRRMFAMRNGVVADVLRKAGSPFSIIFGVNLPELQQIASGFEPSREFAERVWTNTTTRESMLVAPMLMPRDQFSFDDAMRWISQVPATEVADVLSLKLLRHQSYAYDLAKTLIEQEAELPKYTGLRLMCNLAQQHPDEAASIGRAVLAAGNPMMRQPASVLASYDMSL